MTQQRPSRMKILWILPPIFIGIAGVMLMQSGKQPPQLADAGEPVRSVRYQTIRPTDFTPVALGYGEVQPAQVWQAVAQVSGRVIETHPRLDNGELIQQGEVLLKIDPVDYELNLVQAQTQLAELEVQQQNTQRSLEIEQRNLALARKEFERLQRLAKAGSVSQSSADTAERTMLTSTAQVQNLKNSLSLIPTQKRLQQARITQAERDLQNTVVSAPFNLKVTGLTIESDQYVSKGQTMFSGDSVDEVEIVAQVPISSLKNLFDGNASIPGDIQGITSNLTALTGFDPTVRLDMGSGQFATWSARFVRFADAVDSQTRTIGVVVAVDNPLQRTIPGKRPPLQRGMFVEVSIAGRVQPDSIVVPRTALHRGRAYVIDADNRLEIRGVTRKYDQQDLSIISQGLTDGERLVLTDLVPAVQGMLLNPIASGEQPAAMEP